MTKKSPTQSQLAAMEPVRPDGFRTFGIGSPMDPNSPPPVEVPVAQTSPGNQTFPQTYGMALRCDLCSISTNRMDQLEMHKRGARHMRMLKLNGIAVPESSSENHATSTTGPIDYSIYRTPSGQYYCAPCNLSLNSEATFAQHIESKKHKNQVNPKVQSSNATNKKKTAKKK